MQLLGLPEEFWLILTPTDVSTEEDICFKTNWIQFETWIRNGGRVQNIGAICCTESTAKELASLFISIRDATTKKLEEAFERRQEEALAEEGERRLKEDLRIQKQFTGLREDAS